MLLADALIYFGEELIDTLNSRALGIFLSYSFYLNLPIFR